MEWKLDFTSYLMKAYPALAADLERRPELISDQLLSPFQIELPRKILSEIQKAVRSIHALRQRLADQSSEFVPGNFASMMSLDFHLDDQQNLKLIEINTNAAFLILGWEMYRFRGLASPVPEFSPAQWKQDLETEWSLYFKTPLPSSPLVVIMDEEPSQQRLYAEFLVAREWIKSWGWQADIRDVKDAFSEPVPQMIYNRSTDFFLEQGASPALKKAWEKGQLCLTPHPFEYSLLADKERLIEWSRPGKLQALGLTGSDIDVIDRILPRCLDFSSETAESIWAQRKNYFLKPKREYGSKKAFRGASISRKLFDELAGPEMLAQEYVPAPEVEFDGPEGPLKMKYDLRCHFYQDRLESVFARTYQGQVTNLKTPLGGFTPVVFK